MQAALYGPAGFYRSSGAPGRNFRTSAHTSPAWAAAICRLASAVDDRLGHPPDFTVVDMGAGGGELLAALAALAPGRWQLVGVDVAPRPAQLPARVSWSEAIPPGFDGLLVAVEWLDVIPVDCVELTDDGPRLLEVNDQGDERVGGAPGDSDSRWLDRWWPLAEIGDRAEIGRPRDERWAEAIEQVRRGLALAIDYAADPRRDVAGTLTGYRDGRQVLPVPDGSMDLTAHVLFESLTAGGALGRLVAQREALRELGLRGARPSYDGDPASYMSALSEAGAEAELLARGGLGEHRWLMIERSGDEER
jgi:SAM-dependent MidA family methyltransferase